MRQDRILLHPLLSNIFDVAIFPLLDIVVIKGIRFINCDENNELTEEMLSSKPVIIRNTDYNVSLKNLIPVYAPFFRIHTIRYKNGRTITKKINNIIFQHIQPMGYYIICESGERLLCNQDLESITFSN